MAKKLKNKPKIKQRSPILPATSRPFTPQTPSAYTLFRLSHISLQAMEALEKELKKVQPAGQRPYNPELQQIKKIQTAESLVDSAQQAVGLIGFAWHHKAREFGDEVVPLIGERLRAVGGLADARARTRIVETLLGELRWRGPAGAAVLLERFDNLDYHSRSLACVILGLLGAREGADKIWSFYEKVLPQKNKSYFVGALWGLIDLKDPRAAETLVYLASKPRPFYELLSFLALAGDERAIFPLMKLSMTAEDQKKEEPMLALAGIGHRVGREALVAMIEQVTTGDDDAETSSGQVADMILSYPPELVERYFGIFQRGLIENGTETPEEPVQEGELQDA